jgi:hypothetical protein
MPKKFGYEKRRAHLSSLIMTGQLTRKEALERISVPEMSVDFMKNEFEYVANKLDLSIEELESIFQQPNKTFADYRNKFFLINLGAKLINMLGIEKRHYR